MNKQTNKMKNFALHQGDVQCKTITSLPLSAKKIARKPLALGEVSGHAHIVTGPNVELFEDTDGRMYITVGKGGARIQHVLENTVTEKDWMSVEELQKADHDSHLIPEGTYEAFIQTCYNPYTKLMEKSMD